MSTQSASLGTENESHPSDPVPSLADVGGGLALPHPCSIGRRQAAHEPWNLASKHRQTRCAGSSSEKQSLHAALHLDLEQEQEHPKCHWLFRQTTVPLDYVLVTPMRNHSAAISQQSRT